MKETDEQYVPGLEEIKNVFIAKEKPGLLGSVFCCCFEKIKVQV